MSQRSRSIDSPGHSSEGSLETPTSASSSAAGDAQPQTHPRRGWTTRLFEPVSIVPLVYARLIFGALMAVEVYRYFANNWIQRLFIDPKFHFKYYGFEWVHPWPGNGMYVHFAVLGLLAGCILAGFMYRLAMALFFLGFTYVFLLEQVLYLNHFYLLSLVSFLMILVPAHRAWSVDSLLRPGIRTNVAPAWSLFIIRFQIAIPYIYGGIAKITPDWLRGEPMRMWLAQRTDFPFIGDLFTHEATVWFFTYGGLLLDLFIVPMLLWRRTRLLAVVAMATFHMMNSMLFHIGIFPWFMLAATLLFFPAAQWARLGKRLLRIPLPGEGDPHASAAGGTDTAEARDLAPAMQPGAVPDSAVSGGPGENDRQEDRSLPQAPSPWAGSTPAPVRLRPAQKAVAAFVAFWVLFQVLTPFRHHLYPGVVHWTEQGHRFSWHMKLRSKHGQLFIFACDPDSAMCWQINPLNYIEKWQLRKVVDIPDMILQLCHYIAADLRPAYPNIEIVVDAWVSLNGREPQLMIHPEADLAREPRSLRPAAWILPLQDTPIGTHPDPFKRPPPPAMETPETAEEEFPE